MMTVFAVLVCAGAVEAQAIRPEPAQPAIPVPIPNSRYDCRLHTDWAPLLRSNHPVWRYAKRVEGTDSWEEAECGHVGGRFRTLIAQSDDTTTEATTGRARAGDGGIGEGVEWKVYVGSVFDARLAMEFTRTGPRIVLSATYWPIDGREVSLGWSVLAGELVHRHGWFFDAGDIRAAWVWQVHAPVVVAWHSLVGRLR